MSKESSFSDNNDQQLVIDIESKFGKVVGTKQIDIFAHHWCLHPLCC
jgi:hypothetical protein